MAGCGAVKKLLVLAAVLLVTGASAQDSATMHSWRPLLDDKGSAWRGWKSADFPSGWHINGDTISKDGEVDDLVTRETFGDFELDAAAPQVGLRSLERPVLADHHPRNPVE